MTMMVHQLLRLKGDEEDWGEAWERRAELIGEIRLSDWLGAPEWLRGHPCRTPDIWTAFYQVSLDDVRRLMGPSPHAMDAARLVGLPEDGRYAVAWVECY